MYRPSDQVRAASDLEAFWLNIKGNSSVYVNWWCGPPAALWTGGLYDTSPLDKLVRSTFDVKCVAASGVRLSVGAVALGTGEYRFVPCADDTKNFADWIMASSAMPGLFPPRKIDGDAWVDGGVRDATPVLDILNSTDGPVDVILTGPLGKPVTPSDPKSFSSVINVGSRAAQILADEVFQQDIESLSPEQRARVTIYAPEDHLPYDAFNFDPKCIRDSIARGRAVG
jgi:predicted acylesterase/phospholipase RssA